MKRKNTSWTGIKHCFWQSSHSSESKNWFIKTDKAMTAIIKYREARWYTLFNLGTACETSGPKSGRSEPESVRDQLRRGSFITCAEI